MKSSDVQTAMLSHLLTLINALTNMNYEKYIQIEFISFLKMY